MVAHRSGEARCGEGTTLPPETAHVAVVRAAPHWRRRVADAQSDHRGPGGGTAEGAAAGGAAAASAPAPAPAEPAAPRAIRALEMASRLKAASSADLLVTDVGALAQSLMSAQAATRLGAERSLRKVWAERELRAAVRGAAKRLKEARAAQTREAKRQADEAKLEARLQRKVVAQAERAAKKLARRAQKERLRLQKQLGSAFAKEEELGD